MYDRARAIERCVLNDFERHTKRGTNKTANENDVKRIKNRGNRVNSNNPFQAVKARGTFLNYRHAPCDK